MEKMLNFQDHTLYVYDLEVIDSRMYMMREGDEILLVDPCENESLLERIRGAKHARV